MGEVKVEIELENTLDRELQRLGYLQGEHVRTVKTRAVADSGAIMLVLPEDMVEALGLRETRKAIVTYANEQKESRPIAGVVTIRASNREATVECIVGPPGSQPLLGQVPLEVMDLLVDCGKQMLTPRPESPFLPTLNVK